MFHRNKDNLTKLDPSGEKLYSRVLSGAGAAYIDKFCEMQDGRIFLVYMEEDDRGYLKSKLGELDPADGTIARVPYDGLEDGDAIGAGEEGLLCLNESGIWKIDVGNGSRRCVLSFTGTSYVLSGAGVFDEVWDFRMLEEGTAELIWASASGAKALETVAPYGGGAEKKPVVVRGMQFSDFYGTWLKEQAAQFNQQDEEWYIVLEERDEYTEEEDYAMQTNVQIVSGGGPDILCGDVLGDYLYGTLQKGGLEDLAPYMKRDGIREEDFFPSTFSYLWDGGKIYGVNVRMNLMGYTISADFLGGQEEPDINALADALSAGQETAVYIYGKDSMELLRIFLQGSENLWGMVDWEGKTCDFGGELFAELMDAAKRYADDGRKNVEKYIIAYQSYSSLYGFSTSVQREAAGRVKAGIMFDDGCHPMVESYGMVAVNANASEKEGAWRFISFLLGEEVQSAKFEMTTYPVSRSAFEAMIERELAEGRVFKEGTQTSIKGTEDLTEVRIAEAWEAAEEARFLPIRTHKILDIVCEEAENYFNNVKSIEEVCDVIENRVQLYLDEID